MIRYTTGDLLAAEVDAVVNTVNTVGIMGKGLALQFKRRYPANFKAYEAACKAEEVRLGSMFVTETGEIAGPRLIVNFPTKGHWKANSKLDDIRRGLVDLIRVIGEYRITSIAVPPLGAGNGGLNWADVRPLIAEALGDLSDVEVVVYEPSAGHRAVAAASAPKLSRVGALLLELIERYVASRTDYEIDAPPRTASLLEIQKLMYFAERYAPWLGLGFVKYQYGPYSDRLRKLIREYEGSYLEGFGDGTDPVLSLMPIGVTDLGRSALAGFHDAESGDRAAVVEAVLATIDEFDGAYPLELLASVDWAVREIKSRDPQQIRQYIAQWNPRKQRLFTPLHIERALSRVAA